MSTISSFVTGSKVLGAVISSVNYSLGKCEKKHFERSMASLYGIKPAQVGSLTPKQVGVYSVRVIRKLVPDQMRPLGDALAGLCVTMVNSAEKKKILISYQFLRYIFGRALDSDTVVAYLRKDPEFAEGDVTPDDIIQLLYNASPALADAIEDLEDDPLNDPSSQEFKDAIESFKDRKSVV